MLASYKEQREIFYFLKIIVVVEPREYRRETRAEFSTYSSGLINLQRESNPGNNLKSYSGGYFQQKF